MNNIASWPARIGVKPGDVVLLMADLKRMAWTAARASARFHPEVLLAAFVDAVGPEGTLLIPTYTFHLQNGDAFDVRRTMGTSGALGNAALGLPAFHRTPHPLHSFAVAGRDAVRLATSKELDSFGPGSPFAYLHQNKGVLVTLDQSVNDTFTHGHFVEQGERVSYRKQRWLEIQYTDVSGHSELRRYSIFAKSAGHHMDFSPLDAELTRAGVLERGEVDGSNWIRIDLRAAYPVVAANLERGGAQGVHQFRWSWWLRDQVKRAVGLFRKLNKNHVSDAVGKA